MAKNRAGKGVGASEEQLGAYRSKRDFDKTNEPAGSSALSVPSLPDPTQSFVVQRHRARRLHYDFRLSIGGVLVSWAIPRGPSMDPSVKRLAVKVEDHPLEYGSFEGVIPSGEYGAGDVIVWDRGEFTVHGDQSPAEQLAEGALHLQLDGQKLQGGFMLIRTGRGGDDNWLFFHKAEGGIPGWDPEDHPLSVVSSRTNDQVLDGDDELAELDSIGPNGTWKFAGRELKLTNLDRVMFPGVATPGGSAEGALTKRDLIRHYATVSRLLVPFMKDHPVNLHRFPKGVTEAGFWQKAVPKHTPEWVERWDNPGAKSGETKTYFVASEPATFAWLANYGVVEMHPWTSTTTRPDEPSYAIFDLDPGERTTWRNLLDLALLHREALHHLGVIGFPNVSGQSGIQIRVPLESDVSFDEARGWVEAVSRAVGRVRPDLVSWEWNVADRGGLARLDFTQNARNKTIVCPYSPRPAPGAPVATPIRWEELEDPLLRPDRWNISNIVERLADTGDLLDGMGSHARQLPALGN